MQAVITTGGKQYLVAVGQTLNLDLTGDQKQLTFEPLLIIDGSNISVGTPTVTNITVTADVIGEVKGEKLKILKFKAKKRVKKLTGHRQRHTQVKITAIGSEKAKTVPKSAAKTTSKVKPATA